MVAVFASLLLLVITPSLATAKSSPCDGGRYVITGTPSGTRGPALASGVITLDRSSVALGTGCSGGARLRYATAGTKVRATLSPCAGVRGKARFRARIDETCRRMRGSVTTRKGRSYFEAELSLCGNGAVDGGEECDGAACADGSGCNACRCDRDPVAPGCTPGVDPGCAAGGVGPTTTTTLTGAGGTSTSTTLGGGATTTTTTTTLATTTTVPPAPDPFKCYKLRESGAGRFKPGPLSLVDQLGATSSVVNAAERLCNPVDVDGAGVSDPAAHLMCYDLGEEPGFVRRSVVTRNQFGDQTLTLVRPDSLCVPAEKDGTQSALNLDGFKCYRVAQSRREKFAPRSVSLADEFETRVATVQKPILFCNPVDVSGRGVADAENHLTCYRLPGPPGFAPRDVSVEDEFTVQQVRAFRGQCRKAALLCVPSLLNPGAGTTTTLPGPSSTSTTSTSSTTSITGPGSSSTTSTSSTSTASYAPASTTSTSIPGVCGNGVVEGAEECDDDNDDPNDGCTNFCTLCGNLNITAPETCDDGNNDVNDDCPEDCQIGQCTPTASPVQTITITASRPDLSSIRFLLDYPDGKVALPGGPGPDLPPGTITDTPGDPAPFDLEHAVRIVISAGFAFDTTTIAKLNFLGCEGQPAPSPSDYKCIVIDAADGDFQNVTGVTCTAGTGESTTTSSTTTSSTSTTSSTTAGSITTTTASTTITTTSLASMSTLGTSSTTTTSSTSSSTKTSTSTSSTATTTPTSTSTTSSTIGGGTVCSATGLDAIVGVDYPLQTLGGLSAILLKLNYVPPVALPGTGTESTVRMRLLSLAGTGSTLSGINDKDTNADTVEDQIQASVRKTQNSIDPGPAFRVRFDCPAGTNVTLSAFSCSQEQATDLSGSPFVPELASLIQCVVTLSAP